MNAMIFGSFLSSRTKNHEINLRYNTAVSSVKAAATIFCHFRFLFQGGIYSMAALIFVNERFRLHIADQ